jgi:hypothetical protein
MTAARSRPDYERSYGRDFQVVDPALTFKPGTKSPSLRRAIIRRRSGLDLDTIATDTQAILLDRVKEVSGFSRLTQLSGIERISVILCNTTKPESIAQELPVVQLDLHDCTRDFSRTLLELAAPKDLRFNFFDGPFADLTWIHHPQKIAVLVVWHI